MGNTSFACVLTSKAEGRQSSVRETHLDQLHLRAGGTKTPRSRLAGSPSPVCPTSAPFSSAFMSGPDIALHLEAGAQATIRAGYFHLLLCRPQTSPFVSSDAGVL